MGDGMGDALRVGLIGYGDAGRGIHGRLLREAGHAVVGVVTRDAGRADAARADWPGVAVVDDVAGLLGRPDDLDAVVVASPTGLHREHALAAVDAGVPVVVDKPLGVSAAQAREVVEAARRADVGLTVFQNRRWDDEQRTLRSVLASGDLGRVHRFERRWERWRPVPKDRWKENDPVAGGLLLDLGPHLVDSAVELWGPVASVYAEVRAITTAAPDDVFLALHHAGGVVSHLWGGGLVGAPGPRTRVLGDAGAFLVTSFEGEPTPFAVLDDAVAGDPGRGPAPGSHAVPEHGGWLVHGTERVPVPCPPGGHADFYRCVAAWLRTGGPVPVDPADAVRTAEVLDAAALSAAERRVVDLR
ncbi:Gfo/Idh/MocA family oxidoreductase [Cellulomonas sp. ATA003]|uniref:Gfo/Idh/MocA family protein n=1 Tax=Cellulomonas sp. ATA003 TaxID=3073064 RepID=UPI002873C4E7|nr:Gfo/Idh/MocA family oxidoreductase [Cellulomonas sp. ATA003]WNB84482.1 Gfo/Idh/MocA family oxidoreductase [Cellulomonas sp. ATA003]